MKSAIDLNSLIPDTIPENVRKIIIEYYSLNSRQDSKVEDYRWNLATSIALNELWIHFEKRKEPERSDYVKSFLQWAPLHLDQGFQNKITLKERQLKKKITENLKARHKNLIQSLNDTFNLGAISEEELVQKKTVIDQICKGIKDSVYNYKKPYSNETTEMFYGESLENISEYNNGTKNSEETYCDEAISRELLKFFDTPLTSLSHIATKAMKGEVPNISKEKMRNRIRKRTNRKKRKPNR